VPRGATGVTLIGGQPGREPQDHFSSGPFRVATTQSRATRLTRERKPGRELHNESTLARWNCCLTVVMPFHSDARGRQEPSVGDDVYGGVTGHGPVAKSDRSVLRWRWKFSDAADDQDRKDPGYQQWRG
jgi:hypothetical protein